MYCIIYRCLVFQNAYKYSIKYNNMEYKKSKVDPALKGLSAEHDYNRFNPFNPEFTIVIFTHYKTRIAAAILDL